MRRTFTYSLLITCFLLIFSCETRFRTTSVKTDNISVSDNVCTLDSTVVNLYLPFKRILEKDMDRVIAVSKKDMVKDKPESLLTNFLGDLLLDVGKKEAKAENLEGEPAISYFNYGGIRTFLPKGEITVGKIFELMPFENEMVFLKLKGSQIVEFLNIIAGKGGDSVGGVRFKISDGKATKILIGNKPVKDNDFYWLVTNDYIASGGDDMEVLTKNIEYVNSGKKIRDVIISYLEQNYGKKKILDEKLDRRITNG